MGPEYTAIILAGGSCSRFGDELMLKQKVGGKSVLSHSLDAFGGDENCSEILLSVSPAVKSWIDGDPLTFSLPKMKVLNAETSRGESAAAAVKVASTGIVVLHDACRPNFNPDVVGRLTATLKPGIGAATAVEISSAVASVTSIEQRGTDNGSGGGGLLGPKADHRIGHLMEHQQPDGLYELQTPQAYLKDDYLKAAGEAGDLSEFGDDSSMVIAGGGEVAAISGKIANMAVVFESHLRLLDKLMGGGPRRKDKYSGLGW